MSYGYAMTPTFRNGKLAVLESFFIVIVHYMTNAVKTLTS